MCIYFLLSQLCEAIYYFMDENVFLCGTLIDKYDKNSVFFLLVTPLFRAARLYVISECLSFSFELRTR